MLDKDRAQLENQDYDRALGGEGAFWGNFIARRLLEHQEIPGSVDFRLFFTQLSYKHNWGPPCLGPLAINFREREIRYVLAEATRRPGVRVLDLGCGAGWLSLELARLGAHVTAVDISRTNLALGRYMAETNTRNFPFLYQNFAGLPCRLEEFGSVEYLYGDLNTITLPAHEYDAVVVWDSLHHVRDLERLLEQVRCALKPEGAFLGVDHSYVTSRTMAFNQTMAPLLHNLSSWVIGADPHWLYSLVIERARRACWGVPAIDYEVAPRPGFEEFERQVREEMLAVIRDTQPTNSTQDPAESAQSPEEHPGEENASPFEDVSARRLAQALLREFKAERFRTVCPLIMPERHFPPARSEPERLFQHCLAAAVVEVCEAAMEQGQADGQWLLFHLTPERPSRTEVPESCPAGEQPNEIQGRSQSYPPDKLFDLITLDPTYSEGHRQLQALLDYISGIEAELTALRRASEKQSAYITHVESELTRKNAALAKLEARVRAVEAQLDKARSLRVPWKRRARGR